MLGRVCENAAVSKAKQTFCAVVRLCLMPTSRWIPFLFNHQDHHYRSLSQHWLQCRWCSILALRWFVTNAWLVGAVTTRSDEMFPPTEVAINYRIAVPCQAMKWDDLERIQPCKLQIEMVIYIYKNRGSHPSEIVFNATFVLFSLCWSVSLHHHALWGNRNGYWLVVGNGTSLQHTSTFPALYSHQDYGSRGLLACDCSPRKPWWPGEKW